VASDLFIEISGKIDTMTVLKELAGAAVASGVSIDWVDDASEYEVELQTYLSARDGETLKLTKKDTSYGLYQLQAFCQSHNLSYNLSFSDVDSELYYAMHVWTPGMETPANVSISEEGKHPIVTLQEIKEAAKNGMDGINSLIERLDVVKTLEPMEIPQDIMEQWAIDNNLAAPERQQSLCL
jgi:hypothetical protein